jgi:ankyrin repeat protein
VEEYKADIHIKDSEKNTPFLTAVQHDHLSVIRYFVEELGYAVNTSTDGNITAMHIAANNNACDIIEYLISKGTDLSDVGGDIERVSIYGKPINWAVGANRSQASLLLLERGADPNGDTSGPFPAPIILALDFGNT